MGKRSHPRRGQGAKPASPPASPTAAPTATRPPPAPAPAAVARPAPPVARPAATGGWGRFWHGHELPWSQWVVARFGFFGLLAVDAFLQLPHASRYGAGGFNVQHLPGAPLPEPGRVSITFVHAALCLLFALIAQGTLVRVALPLAATLYGWAYFSSQLDSYQHHYLMWLVLVVLCFVPRAPDPLPPGAAAGTPRRVTSWALRLVLVQLGILYLWAAVSKLDPLWLDGSALFLQVKDGWVRDLVARIGFDRVAVVVLVAELALAVAVCVRRLWLPALALGVGLHVGIELVDLEIGLFSYLMLALYLLVVPGRVYLALAARLGPPLTRLGARLPALAAWPVTTALVVAVLIAVPLPLGAAVALFAGFGLAAFVLERVRPRDLTRAVPVGWTFAVAALVPLAVHGATDTADDYFRFWAGSARRLGDAADARRAYDGLLEVEPSSEYAHYYLGMMAVDAGDLDLAARHFVRGQRGAGTRARTYFAEADVRLRQQQPEKARGALEAGLRLEPGNTAARASLQRLGGTPPPMPGVTTPRPDPRPDDDR